MPELDPSHIMQVGMGFFASKALLSAVELGLFTALAKQPMTALEIAKSLGLHARAVPDFPDTLGAHEDSHLGSRLALDSVAPMSRCRLVSSETHDNPLPYNHYCSAPRTRVQ